MGADGEKGTVCILLLLLLGVIRFVCATNLLAAVGSAVGVARLLLLLRPKIFFSSASIDSDSTATDRIGEIFFDMDDGGARHYGTFFLPSFLSCRLPNLALVLVMYNTDQVVFVVWLVSLLLALIGVVVDR